MNVTPVNYRYQFFGHSVICGTGSLTATSTDVLRLNNKKIKLVHTIYCCSVKKKSVMEMVIVEVIFLLTLILLCQGNANVYQ